MLYMHQGLMYYKSVASKPNFINGIPEMTLLRMLLREEMYGYELILAIKQRSQDAFHFGEGCVYPILHRLTAQGYLTTRREVVDGRPRHYYRTSPRGKKHLEKLTQEWTRVVQGTQAILGENYV
jgi:PadR family transcriptional regulator, regulatory protein PadR